MIVNANNCVVKELGHWLIHCDAVLTMNARPDWDEFPVKWHQEGSTPGLQEMNVIQRFVVIDVPVCMADFQCQQYIWICKHWIRVFLEDRITRLMPLTINHANITNVATDFGRRQQIYIFGNTMIMEPVIRGNAANNEVVQFPCLPNTE